MKSKSLPLTLLTICAAALLLRARYSFCWSDEPFYFSTANRFLQGDCIFVHEWFPTQLVSFILLPFQWLYRSAVGSNTGIILYFRFLYVILSYAIAIAVYRIIRKTYGEFIGLVCALFYQFYCHLNIATMSYYTLSVSFFLLSMLLIYNDLISAPASITRDIKSAIKNNRNLILAGFFFALAVLALPSLAVGYFLAAAAAVLLPVFIKSLRPVLWRIFGWTLVGIIIPAIPVLIFTLCTSGLMGIIDNLEYVLTDEEHITSLTGPIRKFFRAVTDVYTRAVYLSVLIAVYGLAADIFRHIKTVSFRDMCDRINKITGRLLIPALFADFILFLYFAFRSLGHTGYISTALLLFSVPLFFLTPHRNRSYQLFTLVFIGGMIFSMTYSYSSNGDLYILALGHSIAAVAGICFVADFIRSSEFKSTIPATVCMAVIMFALLQTMTLRFVNIYRDAPLTELSYVIKDGPAAGLVTTGRHFNDYTAVLQTIRDNETDGTVFFTKLLPWGYLATDMECGAPTTWRTKFNSGRLDLYYAEHPDKIPNVIFVMSDNIGAYDTCGDVVADPAPNENEFGGILSQIVEDGYEKIENPWITVYKK